MSFSFDEEALKKVCQELDGDDEFILNLLRILIDEEHQVRHLIRPHRIVKRIEETIDDNMGESN